MWRRRAKRGSRYGTARIAVRRPPTGFHDILFGVSEVLLYGPCRTPAPVIAHALLQRLATALLAHPPPDWPPVALANGPAAHGLHAWSTPGISELRHEVLLKIMRIIEEHGAKIAFPTRTLHVVPPLPPLGGGRGV